jgi:hypothetical protein
MFSLKDQNVSNGPIPWAKTNNLTFIAEQVSHHPPISAFYAEHVEKRIMCSGNQFYYKVFENFINFNKSF